MAVEHEALSLGRRHPQRQELDAAEGGATPP
jgi:hypothetical protein